MNTAVVTCTNNIFYLFWTTNLKYTVVLDYTTFQTGVVTAATAVALGGCLAVTAVAVHTIIILGSTNAADSAAVHLALTYTGVGLCGELIAMLGLVSTMCLSAGHGR